MLYLASESIGGEAYYLLTALIKEDDGLTWVMLRVASDKPHGLGGFLNETVAELRHVARETQYVENLLDPKDYLPVPRHTTDMFIDKSEMLPSYFLDGLINNY